MEATTLPVAEFEVTLASLPARVVCEYEVESGEPTLYTFVRRCYSDKGKLLNENYRFGHDCEDHEEAIAEFEGFVSKAIAAGSYGNVRRVK